MSRAGERLHFDEHGTATCPMTEKAYLLEDGQVRELDGAVDRVPQIDKES